MFVRLITVALGIIIGFQTPLAAQNAPSTYAGYSGTDTKVIPAAPALGAANSVMNDPTFGSAILRVTDANTNAGESFVSTDSGFHRTWNADSTAIKLLGPHGDGYWLEFNPSTFKVGDGSPRPMIHSLPFAASWEWSTVDPNIIYYLNGNQIAKYNKATGARTNLGGPPNGDPVAYAAVVIGKDNWVCAAAGAGIQDTYTEIYCVNPVSPGTSQFIDVANRKINGIAQSAPNWPTSAPGQVIGIHDVSGGTGANWLEVTFHQQSWGANGGAVFNLGTNTWSLITNADYYWSGHVAVGNGKYANSAGSVDGRDSRGVLLRNPDNAMDSSQYRFVAQPPNTNNGWCDADHLSWFNSTNNATAPILVSRYMANAPNCAFAWTGEIYAAAVDGSNTVWRFAHNHSGGCYYGEGFAQISNDGNWALFSSYWDGTLGPDTAFGCQTRIDTFIVRLANGTTVSPPAITTTSLPAGSQNSPYNAGLTASGGVAPYIWSISSGTLPAGLTLSSSSGTISGTPSSSGTSTFTVLIVDAAAQKTSVTLNLTINASTATTTTIFSAIVPTGTFLSGTTPQELGVKFRSDVSGSIAGIRFYKGLGDTGSHTGSLWSSTGTLLATGSFSGETSTGWQQLNFSTPVPISANTTYIASYHSAGSYFGTWGYFIYGGMDNPPLHALRNGADGSNGVYVFGSGGIFPTQSYMAFNYWVDVVFSQSSPANIAESVVALSGTPQSTVVNTEFASSLQVKVTDSTSNPVSNTVVTFSFPTTGAGATFAGSTTATAVTNSLGIATSPLLTANNVTGSYTATASVNGIAPTTFTLTNTPVVATTATIFSAAAPSGTFLPGTTPLELGVKFRSDVSGTLTGIRFYKGFGDTGSHTGSLWSSAGTLLATGTFSGETDSGWQQLNFSAPVPISANTTYVASYHSSGSYFGTWGFFIYGGADNPPLHALQDGADGSNGIYAYGYGGIFPAQTYMAFNYWVDIVFVPQ